MNESITLQWHKSFERPKIPGKSVRQVELRQADGFTTETIRTVTGTRFARSREHVRLRRIKPHRSVRFQAQTAHANPPCLPDSLETAV